MVDFKVLFTEDLYLVLVQQEIQYTRIRSYDRRISQSTSDLDDFARSNSYYSLLCYTSLQA